MITKVASTLGLLTHDALTDDYIHPLVDEAARRLPPEVKIERDFRRWRATQLSLQHEVLPKEQWVKYEDDVPYLAPYLEEVEKEWLEKANWKQRHGF
ncbi:UQCRB [Cordylochernes scorpioides]|uniref:Cytochrome b-c1 complex subunit 7 n=1 Tax=Cordylochernes scorpioides TaxID=51811 RepID=A0ABY6LUJ1_9ARAC|nr:UQCRB [Cordylochernes scorpioides]